MSAVLASGLLFASCGAAVPTGDEATGGSGTTMTTSAPTNNVLGNPDSSVVLMEFSDLQCPACKSADPSVKSLLSEFGSDIRFEYRHFPLKSIHRNAEMASFVAEAAGIQGKFFEMKDKLFEGQAEWSASAEPMQFFVRYAQELGLDTQKLEQDAQSSEVKAIVARDVALANQLKVNSTPTFFLNGKRLRPTSFSEFSTLVREAVRSQQN